MAIGINMDDSFSPPVPNLELIQEMKKFLEERHQILLEANKRAADALEEFLNAGNN
jgi:hypothetical protein